MLRLLRKTTATVAKIGESDSDKRYDALGDDDLSNWELVDGSESDDEDLFSFDGEDVIIAGDGEICGQIEPKPVRVEDEMPCESSNPVAAAADCAVIDVSVSPPLIYPAVVSLNSSLVYGDGSGDLDDSMNGDDFDEELVPWDLQKKIGRERMKKMEKIGKKGGQRHSKTKRLPCYYKVRPGNLC